MHRTLKAETIIDVISLTEVQFNRLAGCGSKTTREMKKFLNTNGLDFSPVPINELSEPPAGCKKGIQGQLPISFYTPPAWANLNDLSIKIEVL